MSHDRPELTGARWSSATRCIARAEHEALGTPRDDNAQTFLEEFFVRGVNAARAWTRDQKVLTEALGKTLIEEAEIPWGPPEYGWVGHADAMIPEDKLIIESYHAKDGAFREEKALQACGYALEKGDDWRAMLAVLDTTDVDEDAGFAVHYIPLEPAGRADDVAIIKAKVALAVAHGEVNPADRVGETPGHEECRSCPFREPCWAGWVAPEPEDVPGMDDAFARFALLRAKRAFAEAEVKQMTAELDELKDEIREYAPANRTVRAGGIDLTRKLIAPRTGFKLSAYLKAGHPLTPPMQMFASMPDEPGERWYVSSAS